MSLSDDTVIWRYMKLNSFLELLSGHLIQTRIDTLYDASEGAYGWRNMHFSPELLRRLGQSGEPDDIQDAIRKARMHAVATYWFEFDRESYGMWRVYGRSGESVAVETTVGALRKVLSRSGEAWIDRMQYTPMEGEIDRIHTLFFHKRREYKEEQEIRSVQVFDKPLDGPIVDQQLSLDDLNALVKRIILAPYSRKTFIEAVNKIVRAVFAQERKRFAGEICSSALDEDLVPQ
ncbi:MAG TPA: hypothetical protein VGZ02_11680 [Candidatus Baltobacteraceae bacterium]|nr:hypothetical protein [Candidatus Baltobacteraceae bacterium]